jgi:1-acyl-sn-glycerol-3-phosphate acyltransferase
MEIIDIAWRLSSLVSFFKKTFYTQTRGAEHIPSSGPAIFITTHTTHNIDISLLFLGCQQVNCPSFQYSLITFFISGSIVGRGMDVHCSLIRNP